MAGEVETGVTIMRVVRALDAGPMIVKVARTIDPTETSADVEHDLARLGGKALVEAVEAIARRVATETLQDDSEATYAPKIEKADGIIQWSRPAAQIHNQIRGLHPWPHAFSDLDGARTILLKSEVAQGAPNTEAAPGTILEAHGDQFLVQTGGGALRVLLLQREGRRPMTPREFLAGHRVHAGARFLLSASTP